jgi:hypothetical protein
LSESSGCLINIGFQIQTFIQSTSDFGLEASLIVEADVFDYQIGGVNRNASEDRGDNRFFVREPEASPIRP